MPDLSHWVAGDYISIITAIGSVIAAIMAAAAKLQSNDNSRGIKEVTNNVNGHLTSMTAIVKTGAETAKTAAETAATAAATAATTASNVAELLRKHLEESKK